ncbi:hypothetical protein LJB42_000693 [Komagataella kurtzmanii]|nr:hypothetical protein LJB42_000693 [Komagataella kurtzmanii]
MPDYEKDPEMIRPEDTKDLGCTGRILNVMSLLPNQIFKNSEGQWDVKPVRGNSALYSSNDYLIHNTGWETHLIGWTGELYNSDELQPRSIVSNLESDPLYLSEDDKTALTEKMRAANNSPNIHPVWLLRKDQLRWRKYAENVLWPIFHYMQNQPSDGKQETEWWYDYVKFNEAYAARIKKIYKPGDIIWIHDYYLLLLPQILRMSLPKAKISLFLHAPFPSSEYFRCLSKRKHILDGMLGADQIGFQSFSFARHFMSCCSRIVGAEILANSVIAYGAHVSVSVAPIGIDVETIEKYAFESKEVEEKVKAIREINGDKKIIVGRDRLDIVRGVVQKLEAFETFLSMYPQWREKVVLIQVSFPTVFHSAKMEKKVNELIAGINGTYGSFNWTPVQHYQMRVAKDEYLALLRVADLGVITSIRDGNNTTALEYVLCQKKKHSPLILSEFSGTVAVFPEAILINPWDSVGVANTMHKCLLMDSREKTALEANLYNQIQKNTVQDWTRRLLSDLIEDLRLNHSKKGTPNLNRPLLLSNYQTAEHRLFMFDYDGTLTPIVHTPSAAIPSAKLYDTLTLLTKDPRNEIWFISGRDQQFLDKWIGQKLPHIGLSAEHGCFMKKPGSKEWRNLAEDFDMSWQKEVESVFQYYTDNTPGTFIEKKKVAVTWHYRKAEPDFAAFQAANCLQKLLSGVMKKYDVEAMSGKANIEVRPKFVNKGEIVKRLVINADGPGRAPPDFILCLGDDQTDEDMFKALNDIEANWKLEKRPKDRLDGYGVYPVSVGPANKETVAKAYLSDPGQVLETLGLLVGTVSLFETAGTVEINDRGHIVDETFLEPKRF